VAGIAALAVVAGIAIVNRNGGGATSLPPHPERR
jgi:hypothetical protein